MFEDAKVAVSIFDNGKRARSLKKDVGYEDYLALGLMAASW